VIKSLNDLQKIRTDYLKKTAQLKKRITICGGTGCVANGSKKVFAELQRLVEEVGLEYTLDIRMHDDCSGKHLLSESGCQGFCQMGPLLTIEPDDIHYLKVKPEDVQEIVYATICHGKIIDRLLYVDPHTGEKAVGAHDIGFYKKQKRTVLYECGRIDPDNLDEYISKFGYFAAHKAICEYTDKDICEQISFAGLRGRGGGGFPTGRKWELTRIQPGDKKYIICNADEGDPGAFMDRSVKEGNPHSVIEGMMIAAKAVGANEGYVYVRTEYPLAVKRIRKACADAEAIGLLGNNIFGSDFSFKINVMEGAGAFVCGEETALIASVEGKRGMPMPKPPFPAQSGLYGKPTVINNVETLASVPMIIRDGAQKYREMGVPNSPGTKTFALTGHVANTGLIEVPFGSTLRQIVFDIGGGVTGDNGQITKDCFKAVQIGGPSGGCLTEEHLDMPLDFDSLTSIGAMVGSGGLVVMNKHTCMVKVARFFMQFAQNESCGKCVLCREGTRQMLNLLDDIIEGRGTAETLELLQKLALVVKKGSLCGLGKTAPNPVLSTMKYFREEYEAHVFQKRCPAKECKALVPPEILEDKCKGCTMCIKVCPVGAISGEKKQVHFINEAICIKCGACASTCKFKAIVGV
jgi:NADH-quinone oxidoreductase subunit F